ncbi:hypothetical protein [Luteimonas chenhongjianii]|uniref:hypothetical protein n=1 Tax=Luteimonas chenhongjianii TaxID=2006110 RepID=UPI0012FE1223|nr:hypothetical protein [Luteimonas chenhongjianii]
MARLACALLLCALTACQAPAVVPEASGTFTTTPPLDADAVWSGTAEACRGDLGPVVDCLRATMEATGASPEALAASARMAEDGEAGYIARWQTIDGVDVATTEFPFRANTNQGTWLIDASRRICDVDADPFAAADSDRQDIADFRAAHPDAMLFAPAHLEGTQPLDGGGVRLVFATPMRSCHACADVATLRVGYDFDDARRFTGRRVIDLH